MRKRSGVSKTGPVALPLVLLLCAAAPQMRRRFSELSPKNFWVVPCSTHLTFGVACSGPLMACGGQWVPPGIGVLDAVCCGGVWPAAGGGCVAHMEGWGKSRRWYGAAPRWCGGWVCGLRTLVDACGAGGPSRFPGWCSALGDELLRNVRLPGRIAAPLRFFTSMPTARSARCPLREPTRCHSVYETAAQPDVNKSPSAPDLCFAEAPDRSETLREPPRVTGRFRPAAGDTAP